MNYVTTNIRLPEKDYLRLKSEAAKQRKSLAAIIREKVSAGEPPSSNDEIKKIMGELDALARRNRRKLKGKSGVDIIRKMRDNAKW